MADTGREGVERRVGTCGGGVWLVVALLGARLRLLAPLRLLAVERAVHAGAAELAAELAWNREWNGAGAR
eukprot:1028646-Rhodomonas_salina.1